MIGRFLVAWSRRTLGNWWCWRLTMWRSWGREWPVTDHEWYEYALLGMPPLRRKITLLSYDGVDDLEIAARLGLRINEVIWNLVMGTGHIEAVLEAKRRQQSEKGMLEFIDAEYPDGVPRNKTEIN